jgi:hypothetical protein
MKTSAALIATLVLTLAPAAQADRVSAPPGNSGVDQYFETVPTATGNRPPGEAGKSGNPLVSARTQRQLARLGPNGRTAAALAQRTAPTPSRTPVARSATGGGGSSLAAILHAIGGGDSGGMGLLLPAILIASAVGAGGIAILRRRQRA